MNDLDTVISGIRKCLSRKPCSENGCPYENECAVEHLNAPLLRDALTLLKEQEPKLLTFEEVKKHYHIPGELLGSIKKYVDYQNDIVPLYLECNIEDEWVVHWRTYDNIALYLDSWEKDYGKTWRCWTKKPTEMQRMAVAWG